MLVLVVLMLRALVIGIDGVVADIVVIDTLVGCC